MSFDAHVLSYFQELEALERLNESESKAFLDLLVLAVLADTEITEQELAQLDEELTRLPFIWNSEMRDEVVAHSARTREYLEGIVTNEAKIEIFIKGVADKLADEQHRVIALRGFTAIVLADGITDAERERVFDVGSALGFDSDVVTSVIDEVRASLKI